ncbi:MAG: ATP-binding protein [Pseudomonadota bacterium]|nr:ATP-binding protein [Pseudomonadota bacterium]
MSAGPVADESSRTQRQASYVWRILALLNAFRAVFALLLLGISLVRWDTAPWQTNSDLFFFGVLGYWIFSIICGAMLLRGWPRLSRQAWIQLAADLPLLTLIVYSAGGLPAGLGVVFLLPITVSGLVLPVSASASLAATAASILLGAELYQQRVLGTDGAFPQAILLGSIGFLAAASANILARRAEESMHLAERQAIDLKDLSQLNEIVIQTIQSGILVIDAHRQIQLSNGQADRMLLRRNRTAAGRALENVSKELSELLDQWEDAPDTEHLCFQSPADHSEIAPAFTSLGETGENGTLIFLEDMSVTKRRMQDLKLKALGRLSASIAHEIRNPLSAINHASELLAESPTVSSEDRKLTSIVSKHCGRINDIVEDILQLSRQPTAKAEHVELSAWLAGYVRNYREERPMDNFELRLNVPEEAIPVRVDPEHLRRVLSNLIDNALLHGRPADGMPIIQLSVTRATDSQRIFVDVADNGGGIPPHVAANIFEPFFTTSHQGTGLGLFICRELCEFNGASLQLAQEAGPGCRFRLSFHDSQRRTA